MRPLLSVCLATLSFANDWVVLTPESLNNVAGAAEVSALDDGSIRFLGGDNVGRYELSFPVEMEGLSALRIEVLPDDRLPQKGPGRAHNGNFVLSEVVLNNRTGRTNRKVQLVDASASFSQVSWPVGAAIDGRNDTGWGILGNTGARSVAVFNLAQPLDKGRRTLELELLFAYGQQHEIGRLRVSAAASTQTIKATPKGGLSSLEVGINAAIDRGVDYLIDMQDLDGSWKGDRGHYDVGGTALNAYALVKSGLKAEHQAVRRALAYIEANPPAKTYEAGCVLMLYAALDHERYREAARVVLEDLIDWQTGDWGYPGSHGDPLAGHKDLSNTQYGALGYWAATKMGIEVPSIAWQKLAEFTLRYQLGGGGFGYTPGAAARGSMTSAGCAIVALCVPHVDGGLKRQCEASVENALGWLDANFKPSENTGSGASWLLYYLYGIERVGAFTDRDTFNSMDWYKEGARFLLKEQQDKGNWKGDSRPEANTSFALLFLNKATASSSGPGQNRRAKTYGIDDEKIDINLRAAGDSPLTVWVSSFGDAFLDSYTFEEERDLGPRVRHVDYLTHDGVVLGDSRNGGEVWHYTLKEPTGNWDQPEGSYDGKHWDIGLGGFGRPDSPQLAVQTEWHRDDFWAARDVVLDPAALIEPRLQVSFSSAVPAEEGGVRGSLLKLYDEEASFAAHLTQGQGQIAQVAGGEIGDHCLKVTGRQRFRAAVPGWGFPVREKPDEGEYRYLRFRWKKGSGGVMIQLAFNGAWQQRYHAGDNTVGHEPSIQIDKDGPEEWVTVTRDLWGDAGDAHLTGIALTAMDGEAFFDGLYLARKKGDLRKDEDMATEVPEWAPNEGGAFAGEDALVIKINGKEVASLDHETSGFQTVLEGEALRSALVSGKNRIAVHAKNSDIGRALDLGIVDHLRLARINGKPDQPNKDDRLAARVSFPRPGSYEIWARMTILDGVDGEDLTVESPPLVVSISEAFDPALLEYAVDAQRNLLRVGDVTVTTSSDLGGWGKGGAINGRYHDGWICGDGERAPWIEVKLRRPVKANQLLLCHTRVDRNGGGRTGLPTRVAIELNGKGDPLVRELSRDRLRKSVIEFGKSEKIRSFKITILDRSDSDARLKDGVGFSELELQK